MAPIDPAEMARMRVVHQLPGMDTLEVRRDLVYREIEGTPMTMDLYLPSPAARRAAVSAPAAAAAGARGAGESQ